MRATLRRHCLLCRVPSFLITVFTELTVSCCIQTQSPGFGKSLFFCSISALLFLEAYIGRLGLLQNAQVSSSGYIHPCYNTHLHCPPLLFAMSVETHDYAGELIVPSNPTLGDTSDEVATGSNKRREDQAEIQHGRESGKFELPRLSLIGAHRRTQWII